MRVKSILINNFRSLTNTPSTSDGGGIFRFYDEFGKLIESGATISDNITTAETENFILEASSIWNTSSDYKILNGFGTETIKDLSFEAANTYKIVSVNSPGKDHYLKLTFKKPKLISKVQYMTLFTNGTNGITMPKADMTFIDIYNNEKTFELSSSYRNELKKIDFKDLNATRKYFTNKVSSSICMIENFDKVSKIEVDFLEKENTKIRIGFSFDKINWVKIQDDSYVTINSIIDEGNKLNEINFFPKTTNQLCYLKLELSTSDESISSKLKKISLEIKK